MESLFTGIISSKTKIKLLVLMFMNPGTQSYQRQLANEFGVSTNAVLERLNQLSATQIIKSNKQGRPVFTAPTNLTRCFPS